MVDEPREVWLVIDPADKCGWWWASWHIKFLGRHSLLAWYLENPEGILFAFSVLQSR